MAESSLDQNRNKGLIYELQTLKSGQQFLLFSGQIRLLLCPRCLLLGPHLLLGLQSHHFLLEIGRFRLKLLFGRFMRRPLVAEVGDQDGRLSNRYLLELDLPLHLVLERTDRSHVDLMLVDHRVGLLCILLRPFVGVDPSDRARAMKPAASPSTEYTTDRPCIVPHLGPSKILVA
ncbi:3-methyl-2-oxobutanoate hydroxymethyltransferase [Striga asiatica]|uniref:3-methyl-2-oxobutanoate hydroxymethyltransferase n=1 Tax=Striga asiatica TaxID=4170 RepID=A0A5A7P8S8_STRAF|nr:3-methyl-2-oxobutanoate hydroxymethyltransferase [Striga asiatica]